MSVRVIKLGGTSQSLESYNNLIKVLNENIDDKFVIVLSAISQVTNLLVDTNIKKCENINRLIKIHNDFLKKLNITEIKDTIFTMIKYSFINYNDKLQDKINKISLGEHLSSIILNYYLNKNNIKTEIIMASDIIKSNFDNDSLYQLNDIYFDSKYILERFEKNNILITQGFIGSTKNNKLFLLGRGGSDTSGSIIAKELKAKEYQIWTDVNGIYNIDPRLNSDAKVLKQIDYELAQEMAGMGAKVLHPYCIKPCQENNIPIIIKNSKNIYDDFTIINNEINTSSCCLTYQKNISIFKIKTLEMWHNTGFASNIFKIFSDNKVDIDIITTSQYEITVTSKNLEKNTIKIIIDKLEEKYQVKYFNTFEQVSITSRNILAFDKLPSIQELIKEFQFRILLQTFNSNNFAISFLINRKYSTAFINQIYNIIK